LAWRGTLPSWRASIWTNEGFVMDRFLRFEHRSQPVAARKLFVRRLGINLGVAVAILVPSLLIGMIGFAVFEGKDWVEAYDYAAMILSGMGPFEEAATDAGRIFEGTYALYSGLTVVVVASLILAPVFHRVLHSFHVEDDEDEKKEEKSAGKVPRNPKKS
jgi:hypothetical protein